MQERAWTNTNKGRCSKVVPKRNSKSNWLTERERENDVAGTEQIETDHVETSAESFSEMWHFYETTREALCEEEAVDREFDESWKCRIQAEIGGRQCN